MLEIATAKSHKILFLNTLAFTVCFAAWMFNGVLVTFLVDNQVFNWGPVKIGWLLGIPVLTGSLFRLPAGMLTDKFGGKPVFVSLLFLCAVPMYLLSKADSFFLFALCSFGFGLAGVSFSIGIAFTSVWYPRERQGTALGIFGAGNVGAALTTLFAPTMLNRLTNSGANIDGWRQLPVYYALILAGMGVVFALFSENRKPASSSKSFTKMLTPLKHVRVWRFGLYYFLVFGCFVAFSQWLMPYFVNVYYLPMVTAGLFASMFSLPSGVFRALGGWLSDKFGGRQIMYVVLTVSTLISLLIIVPKMEIYSPGQGVMAKRGGVVKEVTSTSIVIDEQSYLLKGKPEIMTNFDDKMLIFPSKQAWQEPVVVVGQTVYKKELLAKGVTRIFFQANVWIFAAFVLILGISWGIGMAAVYKLIPDYFPEEVGVVGGMVGVIGGLGGFVCPIVFGYLLEWSGLWSSCWMFIFVLSLLCIVSLHYVVRKMMLAKHPKDMRKIEGPAAGVRL
ncbi:MAG: MFS transporter [Geobacter sp.]|nr:MFS transporter [Geobacter sp.]